MPTEEELNALHWQTFRAAPLALLQQRSLIFRQTGNAANGGPCTVAGARHLDAVGRNQAAGVEVSLDYAHGTAVSALTTTPGGDGSTWWFPYIERGVGECDVSVDVPVGTIALTAGMNGCSLRLYLNAALGIIKFCHDNNGQYADDRAYAARGFYHLLSVNAGTLERGSPEQNVNNYWTNALAGPASGLYFICMKTQPRCWTVFQSVVVGGRRETRIPRFMRSTLVRVIHPFTGNQAHNGVVAKVDIPLERSLPRSLDELDLPAQTGLQRPRRHSI